VLCEALRPASVLAKSLATLDRISGGRVEVGIGAGWYEPEYAAIGMPLPSPGERLARLREAVVVTRGLMTGDAFTFDGRYHRAFAAVNQPPARQRPRHAHQRLEAVVQLAAADQHGTDLCQLAVLAGSAIGLDVDGEELGGGEGKLGESHTEPVRPGSDGMQHGVRASARPSRGRSSMHPSPRRIGGAR